MILDNITALGKESGLKSFEQVSIATSLCHFVLINTAWWPLHVAGSRAASISVF